MTQRTLKHRDWVKIIDHRQQQIKPKPKKQVTVLFKCTIAAVALLIVGLTISTLSHPDQYPQLSIQQQQNVQQHYTKKLMTGNWQFSHADFEFNQIKIYINLPNSLPLEESVLTHYIQQTLCPAKSDQLWHIIDNRNFMIHLFTGSSIRTGQTIKCITHG
ncbi:hypothetical protein RC083_08120 [Pseudoalteromonas haloplanktis]|uniref:Orphan protein n=1 Tax=Pseudoalteromonas haloplanktis TaxID=228 RepID=A0ABU1BBF2_PSEHA|nr:MULTISPECIES: hypothetical protein [Pseudoalteromonas]MDQ9091552.1 hypothetical protein [Pseudoalteromonas haloplanktis]TMN65813.1 hypothetical protein CWB85_20835 [Pseudoalteromonas sp. S1727]